MCLSTAKVIKAYRGANVSFRTVSGQFHACSSGGEDKYVVISAFGGIRLSYKF